VQRGRQRYYNQPHGRAIEVDEHPLVWVHIERISALQHQLRLIYKKNNKRSI